MEEAYNNQNIEKSVKKKAVSRLKRLLKSSQLQKMKELSEES